MSIEQLENYVENYDDNPIDINMNRIDAMYISRFMHEVIDTLKELKKEINNE